MNWPRPKKAEWRKLCKPEYKRQADAETAVQRFNQRWKYHQATSQVEPITKYAHQGRPATAKEPDILAYRLTGTVSASIEALETAKKSLGKFIIATNQFDVERLSAQAMLEHYTAQGISVERDGFRFFKDPLFFAHSLFLKKPEHHGPDHDNDALPAHLCPGRTPLTTSPDRKQPDYSRSEGQTNPGANHALGFPTL